MNDEILYFRLGPDILNCIKLFIFYSVIVAFDFPTGDGGRSKQVELAYTRGNRTPIWHEPINIKAKIQTYLVLLYLFSLQWSVEQEALVMF